MSDQQPPGYGGTTPGGPTPGDPTPGAPGTPGTPDAGGYAGYGTTETPAPPARGSKRGLIIGASAAVLAVAAGAVVYATTTLSGGGRQPDELVPKSAFAYAKIDLDPAANQKLAARNFFGKFPDVKDKLGDDDNVFENVVAELLDDPEVDYRRDIQPWFDKRAAVAAFPLAGKRPQVIGVLRSKDDVKAKESLDRLIAKAKEEGAPDVEYQIARGYVVLGEKAGVDEAVRVTEKESLDDNEFYNDDVDKLEGDQVVVGWADIGAGFDALKSEIPNAGLIPNMITDQLKGRVVVGLHLTNDYAEVQGFSIGGNADQIAQLKPRSDVVAGLPADTLAAVSFSGFATAFQETTKATGIDLDQLAGEFLQGTDLSLTGDILPTLGDETVLAAGAGADFTTPRIGLVTKPTDPTKADGAGRKIAALLSFFGVEVTSEVAGDRFVLATPDEYTKQLSGGDGGLATAPRFSKAVGDLKDAAFVGYVDLAGLRAGPLAGEMPEGFGAFGMVAGARGNESFFRTRLVAE